MAKRALGRGLSALIPEVKKTSPAAVRDGEASADGGSREIPLAKISPNPFQPRTEFDEEKLNELVSSIKAKGLIQPIVVRPKGKGYEIIVGERRFLAAKRLQMKNISVIMRDSSDEETLELAIIENIQRADLNPIEEARAYNSLMKKYSLTQEAIGQKVGKSRESIANILRLLKLSKEVQGFVLSEKLSMGHARAILSLKDAEKQREMARRVIAQGLSVREVEHLVSLQSEEKTGQKKIKPSSARMLSPYVQSMAENIQEKMGTKVTIKENAKKGMGQIEIHYSSHDDLDRIFHLIG